jgi:succinate dehydrogenase / fumarate reductase membrane anchor subunit
MSQARMQELTYFSLMILFLLTATFHGVNGVYNALVNQGLSGTQKTAVKAVLGVASAVLIVQGVRTALAWADGVPI